MYEKELEKLLHLYKENTFEPEFYAKRISSDELFRDYESFRQIPFMYKEEIRNSTAFERTSTPKDQVYGIFSSSGTSGDKTYYVYSKKDKIVHEKFVKTFYTELGISEDDLGGVFAPIDTGVMAHTMMWQFTTMGAGYVNCPEPSPENMIHTVKTLPVSVIATRPNVVSSIASNLELVKTAQSSNVKKLLMGGGFLSNERRKLLERIWAADCYNMFGMSEMFGPMAGECRYKDGQHYLDDYLMIEILDPLTKEPVKEGEIGMAVYTTLWNKGFPLLRYWTDDLMQLDKSPCKCSSGLPRIRYRGRMADCFVIKGEYVFPEELENCLLKEGIYFDYQAIQNVNGDISVMIETDKKPDSLGRFEVQIKDIFRKDVSIKYVPPKSLNYMGHGARFRKAGECV